MNNFQDVKSDVPAVLFKSIGSLEAQNLQQIEKQILTAIRAEDRSHRLDQDGLLALASLSGVYLSLRRYSDALRIQSILADYQVKFLGADHPSLAHAMRNLVGLLSKLDSPSGMDQSITESE